MLRSYVNELINDRNNKIKSVYTEEEFCKIIAFTINTIMRKMFFGVNIVLVEIIGVEQVYQMHFQ